MDRSHSLASRRRKFAQAAASLCAAKAPQKDGLSHTSVALFAARERHAEDALETGGAVQPDWQHEGASVDLGFGFDSLAVCLARQAAEAR